MILEDFFIDDTINVNWDFVWSLPHFCDLDKDEQNPR